MSFLREYIVIIVIIIFIVSSDFIINSTVKKSIEKIDFKVNLIKENIFKDDYKKENIKKDIEGFEKEWKNIQEKLSYFTEHDELEKVSQEIVTMKSNAENESKEEVYKNTEQLKYKIEHIKNKQKFKLNNVF